MKTLKLTPEAFNDELLSRIKPDQLNWSGDEHIKLVRAIVGQPLGHQGMQAVEALAHVARLQCDEHLQTAGKA